MSRMAKRSFAEALLTAPEAKVRVFPIGGDVQIIIKDINAARRQRKHQKPEDTRHEKGKIKEIAWKKEGNENKNIFYPLLYPK